MGRMPWRTYLWPGLVQVCRLGSWSALGLSVGFAALVNLALASSLLWTELLTPGIRITVWGAVGIVWIASAIASYQWDRRQVALQEPVPTHDTFPIALDHYLKGNWFEAEQVLGGLLRANPRDADAGLMLATLLRHTGRRSEARELLDRLARYEGSAKWWLEIARERQLLAEAEGQTAPATVEAAAEEPSGAPGPAMKAA